MVYTHHKCILLEDYAGCHRLESHCCSFKQLCSLSCLNLSFDNLRNWSWEMIIQSSSEGNAGLLTPKRTLYSDHRHHHSLPNIDHVPATKPSGSPFFLSLILKTNLTNSQSVLKSTILRSNLHIIKCLHLKCTVWILTDEYVPWNHLHNQYIEHFHHPQKSFMSLSSLSFLYPCPQATIDLFFGHDRIVCIFWNFIQIKSYVCMLSCLALFTCNDCEIHPGCCIYHWPVHFYW